MSKSNLPHVISKLLLQVVITSFRSIMSFDDSATVSLVDSDGAARRMPLEKE